MTVVELLDVDLVFVVVVALVSLCNNETLVERLKRGNVSRGRGKAIHELLPKAI